MMKFLWNFNLLTHTHQSVLHELQFKLKLLAACSADQSEEISDADLEFDNTV